jgi:hypothetical protein
VPPGGGQVSRAPAGTQQPHAAAGAWLGRDFADPALWRVPLDEDAVAALADAAEQEPAALVESEALTRVASTVRERLRAHGFVVLAGFPLEGLSLAQVKAAYAALGLHLGWPVSQDRAGTFLAHVEDAGADIARNDQRGHRSAAELSFHADRTDIVALLCVRRAASGGLSRLASSAAVHNTVLEERPDLLEELYRPLPHDRRGEQPPGHAPWCSMPIFARVDGHFVARYIRRFVTASQRWDDAPRLTPSQLEALDLVDDVLDRPGVALAMELEPGDVQLVDNIRLLHSRTAFVDGPTPAERRLLLRLWLAYAESPPLPPEYAPLYGSVEAGAYRGGVWPAEGEPPFFGEPVRGFAPEAVLSRLVPQEPDRALAT